MNYFNYFTEIEDTFIRRRGKHLFLSPLDWALIEGWQDRGIPMHIVIRSIESVFDVFDKLPPGTRTIKSLYYCREEIEAQYKEWLASQAGRSGDADDAAESHFSKEAIAGHIENAISILQGNTNENLSEDTDRAIAMLEELKGQVTTDFETIDATLRDIEKLLERSMLTNWDGEHLKILKKEVASQIRGYKAEMEAATYQNTFELMLLKRLREEAGIPRLGLFYL